MDGALAAMNALRARGNYNPILKAGQLIVVFWRAGHSLVYAKVNAVDPQGPERYYVQIGLDLFASITGEEDLWQYVPDGDRRRASELLSAVTTAEQVARWVGNGATMAVAAGANAGLYGAAATTSGLATLGGGSVAAGGLGMAGGIVTIAAVPALLTTECLAAVGRALTSPEDWETRLAIRGGSLVAGAAGAAGAVGAVSMSGAVGGLSAAGITSGLSTLGGGSVAVGGAGMLGGLSVVAAMAVVPVIVAGGAAGGVVYVTRQAFLEKKFEELCHTANAVGFDNNCRPV